MEIAASPHSVIPFGKNAPELIAKLVESENVQGLVVGLPLSMDGSQRDACQKIQEFIEGLKPFLKVPIETVDERLTTKIAEHSLIESGMRREKRRENRDAVAAALILKTFLDIRRTHGISPFEKGDKKKGVQINE